MTELQIANLEDRISAFIDNELSEQEHLEIAELLMSDASARRIFHRLKFGSETGNSAFAALLKEPVPLSFMRNANQGQRRRKSLWGYE